VSASTIDGASYTVDSVGNRTAKTDQRLALTTNYGYDPIYQLLSATQGSTTTESYTYDAVGNRLSSLGVASYTNNTSNELTATSNASYGYDLNGNALTKTVGSNTTSYAWDYENRLTSVTLPAGGGTASFKYDPFGRRIYKSSSAATSVYAYDGDNLIEETNASGAVVARYSQGLNIDEPLAMLRSSATSFYQADGLGSVTSLSNAAGALAQTYTFDSFGNQTAASGSLTNPFQYTGRESDSETGLYYYRARYYDPQAGRFTSEDPIQFAGGANFYAYVDNNPNLFIDPSGYCPAGFRPLNDDERQRLIRQALSERWNGWGFDPNLKIDEEHKRIACSSFVFINLQRAGIKVPWTSAYNINKGAPNYFPIQPKDLKPGDLLQFDTEGGHLAIATSADPLNGYNFVGSQTSTGPKQVLNWTGIPYWTKRIAGYYQICLPTN